MFQRFAPSLMIKAEVFSHSCPSKGQFNHSHFLLHFVILPPPLHSLCFGSAVNQWFLYADGFFFQQLFSLFFPALRQLCLQSVSWVNRDTVYLDFLTSEIRPTTSIRLNPRLRGSLFLVSPRGPLRSDSRSCGPPGKKPSSPKATS